MKVLICVDDSAHSETTLEFVRSMAWPVDTAMVVVSAVHMPFGAFSEPYGPVAFDLGAWLRELTKLHEDLSARVAQQLAKAGLAVQSRGA